VIFAETLLCEESFFCRRFLLVFFCREAASYSTYANLSAAKPLAAFKTWEGSRKGL